MPPLPMYTAKEAASYLGISMATMYRMIKSGRIKSEHDQHNQLRIPYEVVIVELDRLEREKK